MRIIMMIASIAIVGTGTFCVANGAAAFTSVAFVIGIALLLMGIAEIFIARAVDQQAGQESPISRMEGVIAVVLAVAILTNQLQEDMAVTSTFALWLIVTGLQTLPREDMIFSRSKTQAENLTLLLAVIIEIWGIYMLFNKVAFNLHVTLMLGIVLILLGFDRFRMAMSVDYVRPTFLTGNEEKLEAALRAEKDAMRVSIAAMRTAKEYRARAEKIREDIAHEEKVRKETRIRQSYEQSYKNEGKKL